MKRITRSPKVRSKGSAHVTSNRTQRNPRQAIALLLVMSSLTLLSVFVGEMIYNVHMQSRLAFNFLDGLQAFYSAKAGLKLSLLRLQVYQQVRQSLSKDPALKAVAGMVPTEMIERIWSMPFMLPLPVPPEATPSQKAAIEELNKNSSLAGSIQIQISSESSKLNINQLLAKSLGPNPQPTPSPTPTPGAGPQTPTPQASATPPAELQFRPALEELFNQLLKQRFESDRNFLDSYRNVTGKDLVDAIYMYMHADSNQRPPLNLPKVQEIVSKNGPLYHLSELNLIPALDDELRSLISPSITVFSTPGINVNMASKATLWALFPMLSEEQMNELIKQRDDPDTGKLFADEKAFWTALEKAGLGSKTAELQKKFSEAGIRIVTAEESFRIKIIAQAGAARKTLDAQVMAGSNLVSNLTRGDRVGMNADFRIAAAQQSANQPTQPPGQGTQGTNPSGQAAANTVQLVYWRFY